MESETKSQAMRTLFSYVVQLLNLINGLIEPGMFFLMTLYDQHMYTPLQTHLSPWVARVPRVIQLGNRSITVFNANIVTYSRTLLIIPIAWSLKFEYSISACLLVILHDFLDHVDGIVAKTQKKIYGEKIDDPHFGGFLDAFCDKIVNVFCLWTILQETQFQATSFHLSLAFVLLCYTIIGLETAIGVVRIQDFFNTRPDQNQGAAESSTRASMEGKLKEKLESMGLAFLCLSTGYAQPFYHWPGIAGILCFTLTIRLAYASLAKKLEARKLRENSK